MRPDGAMRPDDGLHPDAEGGQFLQEAQPFTPQPRKVRQDFASKVYSWVLMLLVVAAGTFMLCFQVGRVRSLLSGWPLLNLLLCSSVLLQQIAHFGLSGYVESCILTPWSTKKYMWMLRTPPWNVLYLLEYAVATGAIAAYAGFPFSLKMLGLYGAAAVGILAVFSLYAIVTPFDYSGHGSCVFSSVQVLIFITVASRLMHLGPLVAIGVSGAWAILFLCIVVRETQLTLGSARPAETQNEYSVDMYAFSALHLYHLYFNFYLALIPCTLLADS